MIARGSIGEVHLAAARQHSEIPKKSVWVIDFEIRDTGMRQNMWMLMGVCVEDQETRII